MKPLPIPKKHTAARAIFNAMEKSLYDKSEVCISGLTNGRGQIISNNTFSSTINRIKKHHFSGFHFYTRKDPDLSGVIYLGHFKEPDEASPNNSRQFNDYSDYESLSSPGE